MLDAVESLTSVCTIGLLQGRLRMLVDQHHSVGLDLVEGSGLRVQVPRILRLEGLYSVVLVVCWYLVPLFANWTLSL